MFLNIFMKTQMLRERRCWELQHEFWQNPSFNWPQPQLCHCNKSMWIPNFCNHKYLIQITNTNIKYKHQIQIGNTNTKYEIHFVFSGVPILLKWGHHLLIRWPVLLFWNNHLLIRWPILLFWNNQMGNLTSWGDKILDIVQNVDS